MCLNSHKPLSLFGTGLMHLACNVLRLSGTRLLASVVEILVRLKVNLGLAQYFQLSLGKVKNNASILPFDAFLSFWIQ